MDDVGGPSRLRRVHVPERESHVVGHREPAEAGRVAGAEIAVHVGLAQARVRQRAPGDLRVKLGQRLVVGLARRVLVDPGDVGLALDGHVPPQRAAGARGGRPSRASGFTTFIGSPPA